LTFKESGLEIRRPGIRGYFTLLHLPTTTAILSLIVVASCTTRSVHVDRLVLVLVETFLLVGVAGNYLDETKGRPWKTSIPDPVLWGVGVGALAASSIIGLYLSLQVGWWFMVFVAAWGFLTASYSLELFQGSFHNTVALSVLVALASLGASLVQDPRPTLLVLVVALLSAVIAGYGREHYEEGKAAGRDGMPLPFARRVWRWLMFEIIVIDSIAAIMLIVTVFA